MCFSFRCGQKIGFYVNLVQRNCQPSSQQASQRYTIMISRIFISLGLRWNVRVQNTHHSLTASTKQSGGAAAMVDVRVVWCSIAHNSCKLAVWILASAGRALLCLRTLVCTSVANLRCCSLGLHVLAGLSVPPCIALCPHLALQSSFSPASAGFSYLEMIAINQSSHTNPWAPWLLFLFRCLCRQLQKVQQLGRLTAVRNAVSAGVRFTTHLFQGQMQLDWDLSSEHICRGYLNQLRRMLCVCVFPIRQTNLLSVRGLLL